MAENKYVIREIVCLAGKMLATGRHRVIKPGDCSPEVWDRLVKAAEDSPLKYEIRRDLVESEEEEAEEISNIPTNQMFRMSREACMRIASHYGIKDEGQNRSRIIDQVKSVRDEELKLKSKMGIHEGKEE